ncbi:glycosyltransferase domain-containing protein [Thiolapillus sp.]
MKYLVYTCVFGGYDLIFPPAVVEAEIDYIIITDDPQLQVRGWRSKTVSTTEFANPQLANRYYKMLGHREFPGYDCSLYVDGNIRLLGKTSKLLRAFCSSGAVLGLFQHPHRKNIREESLACVTQGKIVRENNLHRELEYYAKDGFSDQGELVEAGVLLKNHLDPKLDEAMSLWWELYSRFATRDQISLPYVLWKTGAQVLYQGYSFRDANPWFGLYAHLGGKDIPRHYAWIQGRAYDSFFHRLLLDAWHLSWRIRRRFRGIKNTGED